MTADTGHLVLGGGDPVDQGAHLAARVNELIDDPALAGRLGDAGRASVENSSSVDRFAEEVARWCARLSAAKEGAPAT